MADTSQLHVTVSSEAEQLILVDADDRPVGHASKASCHDGRGQRHRAFSLFIFNEHGELLLQQRSRHKRLWPGYWANSCCSHPRQHESMEQATERRLQQELGMRCPLRFLFKFEYQADYRGLGAEHELCWVYSGICTTPVHANANEIEAWRFVTPAELDREMATDPERFTPWLKLEWQQPHRDPAMPAW
ncbi:MAG: isopentenyl-diphosphate Delta-isomerase [Rhodanobacter sp.]|nr:MAG: isopentenyl-diphosphate Delta-isomerase [Rhodanobacter sp.]TAM00658.1 MAG: isopentenyl-diphosphate Delta-isomerase [Rhodanobacter sp.]TAM40631.1 MAG: isopentenyl-diphosphate Delta-isomerase [Rhodanobacter sp.]TAN25548.1 MAG: isopentenyl-diphosphate Delta-isomerase [Rhodanobacter sp.]